MIVTECSGCRLIRALSSGYRTSLRPLEMTSRSRYSSNRKKMTDERLKSKIKEGRGNGVLEAYQPWLKVREVPSRGSSHILPGVKVLREHQLLSDAEYHYNITLEFDPSVIDIREQFPLLPREETAAIASSLGYPLTRYPYSSELLVFTTDFLVTKLDNHGKEYLEAKSIKYLRDLKKAQADGKAEPIMQRLQIEREYWSRRGVDWKLEFAENLSDVYLNNLIALRTYANLPVRLDKPQLVEKIINYLMLAQTDKIPVKTLLQKMSKYLFLPYVDVKILYFHLLWRQRLTAKLNQVRIELSAPLEIGFTDKQSLSYGSASSCLK